MALCRFERFAHQRRVHRSISPSGAVAAVVMQIVQHSVIERGELAAFFHFSAAAREAPVFDIKSRDARCCARSLSSRRVYLVGRSVGRSVLISGNPGQTFLLQLLSAGDASSSLSARLAWRWVSECVCRPRAAAPGRRPVCRGAGTRRRPPKGPSARSAVLSGDVNAFIPCLCCVCAFCCCCVLADCCGRLVRAALAGPLFVLYVWVRLAELSVTIQVSICWLDCFCSVTAPLLWSPIDTRYFFFKWILLSDG